MANNRKPWSQLTSVEKRRLIDLENRKIKKQLNQRTIDKLYALKRSLQDGR